MIYVAGIIGFITGFTVGQMLLLYLLRGRSNEDILKSGQIKWTYGLLNWVFAAIGSYAFVTLYKIYFLAS